MAAFSSKLPACSVARTVEPKRRKVSESEKNLRLAQKELARIKVPRSACQNVLITSWSTGLTVVAALLYCAPNLHRSELTSAGLVSTHLQEEVVSLSAQLAQLRTQFSEKTGEQADLKAKADLMERRLTAASKLIVGLSSERTRWTSDMQASPWCECATASQL